MSAREANAPRWCHDGRQLFDTEIARDYDIAANGDIYTMVPAPDTAHQRYIQLRTRWFEEVERIVNR